MTPGFYVFSEPTSNKWVTVTTTSFSCEHNRNGFWGSVEFLGLFKKRVYVCEDCHRILTGKQMPKEKK